MKNDSNKSREVPNLTEENTTTNTTKLFSILNDKRRLKKIWGEMRNSELGIYINKNQVHKFY